MTAPATRARSSTSGSFLLRGEEKGVGWCFLGKTAHGVDPESEADKLLPAGTERAFLQQVHGEHVVDAKAGACGAGDALISARPGLALQVVTADCVPVLLAYREQVAAVHAGWRGIVAGVLPRTVESVMATRAADSAADEIRAWIGPHIGPCCYEVGEDVAQQVVASSGAGARVAGPGNNPSLDLGLAVRHQLEALGYPLSIRRVGPCTRCHPRELWSYRREGPAAGRNLALIWRRPGSPS